MHWKARLTLFAAALWWGSLGAIGFLAVPLLFRNAPTVSVAGQLAGRLFEAQSWLSLACGIVVLMGARDEDGTATMGWARGAVGFVLVGMLCALLQQFAVAPRILARQDLAFWHSFGTALYAVQWVCAGVVLWKVTGDGRDPSGDSRHPSGDSRHPSGDSRHPRAGGDPESARSAPSGALDSRLRGNDGGGLRGNDGGSLRGNDGGGTPRQ